MTKEQKPFLVVRNATGEVVRRCETLAGARRSMDRADNAYGAYAHSIREIVDGKLIGRM